MIAIASSRHWSLLGVACGIGAFLTEKSQRILQEGGGVARPFAGSVAFGVKQAQSKARYFELREKALQVAGRERLCASGKLEHADTFARE